MLLEEAVAKRQKLADEIRQLVVKFETETGLEVENVGLARVNVGSLMCPNISLVDVDIQVRL